jgi:hypothetical protein
MEMCRAGFGTVQKRADRQTMAQDALAGNGFFSVLGERINGGAFELCDSPDNQRRFSVKMAKNRQIEGKNPKKSRFRKQNFDK